MCTLTSTTFPLSLFLSLLVLTSLQSLPSSFYSSSSSPSFICIWRKELFTLTSPTFPLAFSLSPLTFYLSSSSPSSNPSLPRPFLPLHHHLLFISGEKELFTLTSSSTFPLSHSLSLLTSLQSLPSSLVSVEASIVSPRLDLSPRRPVSPARRPAPFDPLDGDYRDESEAVQGRVKEAIETKSVGAQARPTPVFTGYVGILGFTENSGLPFYFLYRDCCTRYFLKFCGRQVMWMFLFVIEGLMQKW